MPSPPHCQYAASNQRKDPEGCGFRSPLAGIPLDAGLQGARSESSVVDPLQARRSIRCRTARQIRTEPHCTERTMNHRADAGVTASSVEMPMARSATQTASRQRHTRSIYPSGAAPSSQCDRVAKADCRGARQRRQECCDNDRHADQRRRPAAAWENDALNQIPGEQREHQPEQFEAGEPAHCRNEIIRIRRMLPAHAEADRTLLLLSKSSHRAKGARITQLTDQTLMMVGGTGPHLLLCISFLHILFCYILVTISW